MGVFKGKGDPKRKKVGGGGGGGAYKIWNSRLWETFKQVEWYVLATQILLCFFKSLDHKAVHSYGGLHGYLHHYVLCCRRFVRTSMCE